MKLVRWSIILGLGLLSTLTFQPTVHAEEENSSDDIEVDSNFVVPSEEELDSINQMEVVENVTDTGATFDNEALAGTKQFLTVVTPEGRTYYIIVNYDQFGTTVNLLKDLSEPDIEELSSNTPQAGNMTPSQAEAAMVQNAEGESAIAVQGEASDEEGVNVAVILVGVAVIGGVAYYFKIVKGKENNNSF